MKDPVTAEATSPVAQRAIEALHRANLGDERAALRRTLDPADLDLVMVATRRRQQGAAR